MALEYLNGIRLSAYGSLVLFTFLFLTSCQHNKEPAGIESSILWEDEKAVGINIPLGSIPDFGKTTFVNQLSISVENHSDTPILGEWIIEKKLTFIPLVPFSSGITYEIYSGNQLIETFEVKGIAGNPPQILAIYPSADTVPENLLKMYLQFSSPMKEGEAIRNISVTDLGSGDTLSGTFLELKPELWNEDNTLLTLWLDPGRIKRGLIPNQERGTPLLEGNRYEIIISSDWHGANGLPLSQAFTKQIYAGARDSHSPNPEKWIIMIPDGGSQNPLKIEFGESLDGILAVEALVILDSDRKVISGSETLSEKETVYEFKPDSPWQTGNYIILIETRLEDLAGNNINRLFEMDISGREESVNNGESVELTFQIY